MNKILKNISLSEIIPYEKNNKKHWKNVDEIIKSIQANTYITPIIIDENNIILAWHGRKLALDKLQVTEAEVLQVSGLSEEQKRDFRIRDNKLTELSEWDRDNLKFELDDLNIPDLTDLFKDEKEMEEETPEAKEDDFEVDDQIKTDIVLGDLFEIGNHRLLCGDSTDSDQVAKLMNGNKADMVFTDPPYGMNFQSNFREKTPQFSKIKNDDKILDIAPILFFLMKDNSPAYVCTRWDLYPIWFNQMADCFNIKNCIVWYKKGGGLGDLKNSYSPNHEFIIVGHKGNSQLTGKRNSDVWEIGRDGVNDYKHPTQKPVELSSFAMQNHSYNNGLIVDLFLGSGSTMVAAHQLKRKCYGMELDPKYCQVIIDRMINLDPSLTFKKNWQPYNPETNDYLLDK